MTFRRELPTGGGLLLVESAESRVNTAIHMWAVFFPLGVVWIDSNRLVVDTKLARPWGIYIPKEAARYILEGSPSILGSVAVGDRLEFSNETTS